MQTTTFRKLIPMFMASAALWLPIPANSADLPPEAAHLEIVGIKLGMSYEDALQALKRYDAKVEITKYYYCDSDTGVGTVEESCSNRPKVVPFVEFSSRMISSEVDANGYGESVDVLLSPETHRVIGVTLQRRYSPSKRGSAAVIDKAILAKFPPDSVRFSLPKNIEIGYFVDREGHSLNDDITKYNKNQVGDADQSFIEMFIQNSINGQIPHDTPPDGGIGFAAATSGDETSGIMGFGLCLVNFDDWVAGGVAETKIDKINLAAHNALLAKQTHGTNF